MEVTFSFTLPVMKIDLNDNRSLLHFNIIMLASINIAEIHIGIKVSQRLRLIHQKGVSIRIESLKAKIKAAGHGQWQRLNSTDNGNVKASKETM